MSKNSPKNRNAFAGRNVELLFRNSIENNPAAIQAIQKEFKICSSYRTSIHSGSHGEKCDVKMEFECGRNIDVNIKAYKSPGAMLNQASRSSLSNFGKALNLPPELVKGLQGAFKRKAENPRAFPLIRKEHRGLWEQKLGPFAKQIVKRSLSSHPSREILALFDRGENVMRLYKMSTVLSQLNYEIGWTPKGNIKIGDCFQLQRKGGDGNITTYPKTDPKHPGNNMQVKLDIKSFLENFQPFAQYSV